MIQNHVRAVLDQSQNRAAVARRQGMAWALGVDKLYKFRSLDPSVREFALDIIEHSRLYFPAPVQLNDPLDCLPVIELAGDPNDPEFVKELYAEEERVWRAVGHSAEDIERKRTTEGIPIAQLPAVATEGVRKLLREDMRVFSASAEQQHPLLWSHYADSHKGICLHLRTREGSVIGLAEQVQYRAEREPILIPFGYQSESEVAARVASIKADFWAYEKEFRIVGYLDTDWGYQFHEGHFVSFEPELLCGITLGMCISAGDRELILDLAAGPKPPIPVWQAREDHQRFWMDIERVA